MDIKLNLINRSNDMNNSEVVVFVKNTASGSDGTVIAWQVIQNLGQGFNHPFEFPASTEVSIGDSWGNFSPKLEASQGQQFEAQKSQSGDQLVLQGQGPDPYDYTVVNGLPNGAISAQISKGGKVMLETKAIAPGQKAVFSFQAKLWIGAVSQVEEGWVLNPEILSNIDTMLDVRGLESADIVWSGGGTGPSAQPDQFVLRNVVTAPE